MKRMSLPWTIGVLAAALALLGTLHLYQQPDFLLTLADQLWGCF